MWTQKEESPLNMVIDDKITVLLKEKKFLKDFCYISLNIML